MNKAYRNPLAIKLGLTDVDHIYAELIALHEGRSEAESHIINARLILLLANLVGSDDLVLNAIRQANTIDTAAKAKS